MVKVAINIFQANVPFLYSLKTSKKQKIESVFFFLRVFRCFQWILKWNVDLKWVKKGVKIFYLHQLFKYQLFKFGHQPYLKLVNSQSMTKQYHPRSSKDGDLEVFIRATGINQGEIKPVINIFTCNFNRNQNRKLCICTMSSKSCFTKHDRFLSV